LIDLFSPEAKKPPKGPIVLAKRDNTKTCKCTAIKRIGILSKLKA
jgi:hypothetical protein